MLNPTLVTQYNEMTVNCITNLLDLLQEEVRALEVHPGADLCHSLVDDLVVWGRQFDAGEQIGRDAVEQRQVVVEKLG